MSKKITSRTGLFGTTVHYDEKGRKIGERAVRASSAAKFTTMRRAAR